MLARIRLRLVIMSSICLLAFQLPAHSQTQSWAVNATAAMTKDGAQYVYKCPAGGPLPTPGTPYAIAGGPVFYLPTSSVCNAAVNSGIIGRSTGGVIAVEIHLVCNIPGIGAFVAGCFEVTTAAGPFGPKPPTLIGPNTTPTWLPLLSPAVPITFRWTDNGCFESAPCGNDFVLALYFCSRAPIDAAGHSECSTKATKDWKSTSLAVGQVTTYTATAPPATCYVWFVAAQDPDAPQPQSSTNQMGFCTQ